MYWIQGWMVFSFSRNTIVSRWASTWQGDWNVALLNDYLLGPLIAVRDEHPLFYQAE
ncbi:hypothetical protein [Flagellimonas lutimaris]|uniref:hypothetical protein n=1 Tax=Flagellimonas lutimaris TaxID=475082 RepID=UPI001603CA39|nr:hypothetical protein [Allomuricauda lutimaris]